MKNKSVEMRNQRQEMINERRGSSEIPMHFILNQRPLLIFTIL